MAPPLTIAQPSGCGSSALIYYYFCCCFQGSITPGGVFPSLQEDGDWLVTRSCVALIPRNENSRARVIAARHGGTTTIPHPMNYIRFVDLEAFEDLEKLKVEWFTDHQWVACGSHEKAAKLAQPNWPIITLPEWNQNEIKLAAFWCHPKLAKREIKLLNSRLREEGKNLKLIFSQKNDTKLEASSGEAGPPAPAPTDLQSFCQIYSYLISLYLQPIEDSHQADSRNSDDLKIFRRSNLLLKPRWKSDQAKILGQEWLSKFKASEDDLWKFWEIMMGKSTKLNEDEETSGEKKSQEKDKGNETSGTHPEIPKTEPKEKVELEAVLKKKAVMKDQAVEAPVAEAPLLEAVPVEALPVPQVEAPPIERASTPVVIAAATSTLSPPTPAPPTPAPIIAPSSKKSPSPLTVPCFGAPSPLLPAVPLPDVESCKEGSLEASEVLPEIPTEIVDSNLSGALRSNLAEPVASVPQNVCALLCDSIGAPSPPPLKQSPSVTNLRQPHLLTPIAEERSDLSGDQAGDQTPRFSSRLRSSNLNTNSASHPQPPSVVHALGNTVHRISDRTSITAIAQFPDLQIEPLAEPLAEPFAEPFAEPLTGSLAGALIQGREIAYEQGPPALDDMRESSQLVGNCLVLSRQATPQRPSRGSSPRSLSCAVIIDSDYDIGQVVMPDRRETPPRLSIGRQQPCEIMDNSCRGQSVVRDMVKVWERSMSPDASMAPSGARQSAMRARVEQKRRTAARNSLRQMISEDDDILSEVIEDVAPLPSEEEYTHQICLAPHQVKKRRYSENQSLMVYPHSAPLLVSDTIPNQDNEAIFPTEPGIEDIDTLERDIKLLKHQMNMAARQWRMCEAALGTMTTRLEERKALFDATRR